MRCADKTFGKTRNEWLSMGSCPEHPFIRLGWCKWKHEDKRNDRVFMETFEQKQIEKDEHDCLDAVLVKKIAKNWTSFNCGICDFRWGSHDSVRG